jgi:hypothetical protein
MDFQQTVRTITLETSEGTNEFKQGYQRRWIYEYTTEPLVHDSNTFVMKLLFKN